MPIQNINTGSSANAGNGDSIRLAFDKVNRNFSFVQTNLDTLSAGNFTSLRVTTTSTLNNLTVTGTTYLNTVESASFYNNTYFENIVVSDKSTLNHVTATDVTVTGNAKIDTLDVLTSLSVGSYQIAAINDYDDFSIIKNDATGLAVVLLNTNADSNSKLVVKDNISGGLAILHQNVTNLAGDFVSGENYIYGETPTDVIHIGAYSDLKFSASQAKYYNPSLPETPSMVIQSIDGTVHVYTSATFHSDVYGITGVGTLDRLTSQDLSKVVTLNNNGSLVPSADLTYDLGSTSSQWRSLYVGTSTIYLGGTALSVAGGNITINGNPIQAGAQTGSTSTLVNGTYTVSLSSIGALTLPGGAGLRSVGVTGASGRQSLASTRTDGSLFLTANSSTSGSVLLMGQQNYIISGSDISNGATYKQWAFGQDGSLTFPDSTVQSSAYPGVLVPANGDGVSGSANLVFYDGEWKNTSKVGINPTSGMLTLNGVAGAGGITLPNGTVIDGTPAGATTVTLDQLTDTGWIGTLVFTRQDATTYQALPNGPTMAFTSTNWILGYDSTLWFSSTDLVTWTAGPYAGTTPPTGVLSIATTDITFSGNTWTFGEDGKLALPATGKISNSTHDWTFGTGGVLTLPGNLTFPDLTVQTTAWTGSVSSLVNSTQTVSLSTTGNLTLPLAGRIVNNSNTWTFSSNGNTIFPTGLTLGAPRGVNTVNFTCAANKEFQIETGTTSTGKLWRFGIDGRTILPIGVSIDEYYGSHFPRIVADTGKAFSVQGLGSTGSVALQWIETESTSSQIAQVGLNKFSGVAAVTLTAGTTTADMKMWRFDSTGTLTLPAGGTITEGGGFTGAIKLTPAGGANAYQALVIYPTAAAPDGDHLHLTAGGGTTELYLGNDYHYVKLVNGGNVEIKATTASHSTSSSWTFGTDGRLVNLDGLTLTAGGQFNICTIINAGSGYDTGSALKATTGGSGTGMTVGIGYGLSNQLASVTVVDPGTGYVNGDVITVSEGTDGTFILTQYNELGNQGNNNFVQSNWTFGTDGTTFFPDGTNFGEINGAGTIGFAANPGSEFTIDTTGGSWSFGNDGKLTLSTAGIVRSGTDTAQVGYSYGPYANDIYNNTTGGALSSGYVTAVNVGSSVTDALFNPATPTATTTNGTIDANGIFVSSTSTGTFSMGTTIIVNGAYIGNLDYIDIANPGAGLTLAVGGSYSGPVVTSGTLIKGYSGWITRTPKTTTYVRWADGSSSQVTGSETNNYINDIIAGLITTDNVSGKSFPITLYTANYAAAIVPEWTFGSNGSLTFPDATVQTTAWTGTTTAFNTATLVANAVTATTVSGAAQPNITSVGTLTSLTVSGEIVAQKLTIELTTVTTTLIKTDDIIQTTNNTASTSTTTGALVIAGGVGVGGSVFVGGVISLPNGATLKDSSNTALAFGQGAGAGVQGLGSVAIGLNSGNVAQGYYSVALGIAAGRNNQADGAVAVGQQSGNANQGTNAVAIGGYAGETNQSTGTIIINASGNATNGVSGQQNSLYIRPIRSATTTSGVLQYNPTTYEVTYSTTITATASAGTTSTTAAALGYIGMPQNSTATSYTLVAGDQGKHIYISATGQTITIPANTAVAFPIGTTIAFIAGPSATTVTIAITTDTMYLGGTGTTGNRTLAAYGMATAVKVTATTWYINGTGLT